MHITTRLKEIIPDILTRFPSIQVMYLFGSHACGGQRPDSDVDIAVFTDGREAATMDLELGVFLQQRLQQPVDVVIMQKVSPILQHEVLLKRIRIFERNPAARAFLENESLRSYLDARHYQRKRTFWRRSHGQDLRHSTSP